MSDGFGRLAGIAGGYVEARILQAAVALEVFDALEEIRGWFGRAGLTDAGRVELPAPLTSSLVIGRKP